MIALNREKPESCLSCPCLQTLGNISSENSKTYAVRYCAAKPKEICVYEEVKDELLPDSFYDFNIPNWCPWIEMGAPIREDNKDKWHIIRRFI